MLDHDRLLVRIREILSGALAPKAAEEWLRTPNAALRARTPLNAISTGDGEAVWALAVAIAQGRR